MANKQVYILQDLGISNDDFHSITKQLQRKFDFTFESSFIQKQEVEGLITINKKLDADFLSQFPALRFVAVAFTGYDSLDIDYCAKHSIAVFNVPSYATDSVAELTLGSALSLLREIPKGNNWIRKGKWDLGSAGIELKGKKVGIVGTGTIGTRVGELFKAFGCEVLGWSQSKRTSFEALGTYVDDLQELCTQVDILTLHVPLKEQTIGLIGEKELSVMNSTSYLINMARGPVVEQSALLNALQNHQIAGAAIDVFDQEPIGSHHPYFELDNILLTPHIAYKTNEALLRRAQITLDNISAFNLGEPKNLVQ